MAVPAALQKKIAAYLVTNHSLSSLQTAKKLIPPELPFWGKLKFLNDGDLVHAQDLSASRGSARDMTFVKVVYAAYCCFKY
jgi:hypothetical protein